MKKLWVLLLALVLLAGCNPPTPPEKPNPPDDQPNGYEASIDNVVDGDTVHLKNPVLGTTKVRMLSIDAPETNYQGKSQGKYGEEAKAYLKQLLPEGTKVEVIPGKQAKDDYGRLLAYIQKGDMDINREMILQGKAVPYIIYPNFERVQPYLDSLKEAMKDGRGIWNPNDPLDELPYEFRLRVGHRQHDKYAGNYETKEYVEPDQYKDIPIEQRVFFWNEEDAKKAGYKNWNLSSTFQSGQLTMIGIPKKLGVICKPRAFVERQTVKCMWHIWGDRSKWKNASFVVQGVHKETNQTELTEFSITSTLNYSPNNGADYSVPSYIAFSKPGRWRADVYIDQKFFGSIVVDVKKKTSP